MQITVRYFAIVREIVGRSDEIRDVPDGATTDDLFAAIAEEHPRLTNMKRSMMLMVNHEFVEPAHQLQDGDEFALIPPVSGGTVTRFRVTDQPLDARAIEAEVAAPGAGAIITFTGTVRDHARGRTVIALDYEAYAPAAEKMLARIGDEIHDSWGLDRVAIVHRTGRLLPGEASVVIAVASAHRAEAFDACRHAIERIKQIVPIWKKEVYEGGETWIGSEAEYQAEVATL